MKLLTIMLILFSIIGCKSEHSEVEKSNASKIALSDEMIAELKSKSRVTEQLDYIYKHYHHLLDRSDNLAGIDINKNGIRDDIEDYIDNLQVDEPTKHLVKQFAHAFQKPMLHDFNDDTHESKILARKIAKLHTKAHACQAYMNISIDNLNVTDKLTSLTYNTKERTLAYLRYNSLLSGGVYTLLPAKGEYCE
ncbi:chromosome partitioning protein ParA [Vibrio astriarenae]|uniref:Chromosome partitioning protein ParA n=1 Tax=Vibrio astriarenae TaxID=1481923 RepID=A0A7Z2T646_9VIBR|nr:chromosome partitioning protein ParA [Vibrio astriarenae]QIA65022.1 chromosome partitioning protein ParA [Vibrio astriarenae]